MKQEETYYGIWDKQKILYILIMKDNDKFYNDLSISMLKNQQELKQPLSHPVNEVLPNVEPHTIISLIGTTNSGKSVLINNIVFKWYLNIFDTIILISNASTKPLNIRRAVFAIIIARVAAIPSQGIPFIILIWRSLLVGIHLSAG